MRNQETRNSPCRGELWRHLSLATLAITTVFAFAAVPLAQAAGAPQIGATWVSTVTASSANLQAEVNANALFTAYRFEYLTRAKYLENGETFAGASKAPKIGEASMGAASTFQVAFQHVASLTPSTIYEYRIVATNSAGSTPSSPRAFTTQESSPSLALPDARGWEMVSPVDKNGGAIQGFGANHGGDVLQAAAQGGTVTYSSASSFGEAPEGAPPASQYVARRSAGGWTSENITTPTLSGSYGTEPAGVPYRVFASDLSRSLMLNGQPCRGEGEGCPVANPPLAGTGAPAGYQDYYMRDSETGAFSALLRQPQVASLALDPAEFSLTLVGNSPDLRHVVLSTCAALTEHAAEVAAPGGCDPSKQNLYEYAEGQLRLINVLPAHTQSTPGASLAAAATAVSVDGSRVYFNDEESLYVDESGTTRLVAPEAEFQTATPNGELAFYLREEKLFRYDASAHTSTALTPSGGVIGMLGASEDGSRLYYATAGGILTWSSGIATVTAVPGAALPSDFPPATGTARVSADGKRLLFLSTASESLSSYDNTDAASTVPCGQPKGICDPEVYLYDVTSNVLHCVSCNPTGERPSGASTIPGSDANGEGPEATRSYKPRVLSSGGRRVFFDSADSLVPADTDNRPDVYEWEFSGEGSCTKPEGCLALISSGRGSEGATFVDASADGSEAFFLTGTSLVPQDPGSADLYDARIDGGFPEGPAPLVCESDECTPLPAGAEDPTVGTLIPGPGNNPLPKEKHCAKRKRKVYRHGKELCVARHHKHHGKAHE